jgi:hypothetical protein
VIKATMHEFSDANEMSTIQQLFTAEFRSISSGVKALSDVEKVDGKSEKKMPGRLNKNHDGKR